MAEPTRVREGLDLWAVEVDCEDRIGRYRGQISATLEDLDITGTDGARRGGAPEPGSNGVSGRTRPETLVILGSGYRRR